MTLDIDPHQAAAFLLLGIAVGIMLGAAGAYSAITDAIEARAADGVPISIGGKLYDVREMDRGMNLSETWERLKHWEGGTQKSSHFNAGMNAPHTSVNERFKYG